MNSDLSADQYAAAAGLASFPTWPPPSGGAPVTAWEMGPILNPFPYGSTQPANISSSPPAPAHPWNSTFFPKKMPPANGQNQPGRAGSLPWPYPAKITNEPEKADPFFSRISS